jgi:V8-like Glu-specific endopeptidase
MFTKSLTVTCMLSLVGMSACGIAELDTPDGLEAQPPELLRTSESNVIVGELDWSSTTSLPTDSQERARSKAVGHLRYFKEGRFKRCTAWLASKDVLITNNHCVGTSEVAAGATVSFNYEDGVSESNLIKYNCPVLIKTSTSPDITALRCNSLNGKYPGEVYGYLSVAGSDASVAAPIYVIHQNCDPNAATCTATKKYSPGVVRNANYGTYSQLHDADTENGSSGAPMLSGSSHQVVGLNRGNNTSLNIAEKASALRAFLADVPL